MPGCKYEFENGLLLLVKRSGLKRASEVSESFNWEVSVERQLREIFGKRDVFLRGRRWGRGGSGVKFISHFANIICLHYKVI